jgi:hypothetical protein
VVPEAGPIEDDTFDAGGLCPLGDEASDHASLLGLGLLRPAKLLSRVDAAATVRPDESSITWA